MKRDEDGVGTLPAPSFSFAHAQLRIAIADSHGIEDWQVRFEPNRTVPSSRVHEGFSPTFPIGNQQLQLAFRHCLSRARPITARTANGRIAIRSRCSVLMSRPRAQSSSARFGPTRPYRVRRRDGEGQAMRRLERRWPVRSTVPGPRFPTTGLPSRPGMARRSRSTTRIATAACSPISTSTCFGEGTHYRAFEKLGAHRVQVGTHHGVHFAVWAPSAIACRWSAISTAGTGASHPMRLSAVRRLGAVHPRPARMARSTSTRFGRRPGTC